ncbi:MAG: hypothetical protein QOH46_623, partial [Solirubrobacteraceae bacterium]|nr:hypothetical protein [Solirubrobacteraceae bacterium]
MARFLTLLVAIPVLALSLASPAAAATTTWTSLPAPWYGPTVAGTTNDAPGYRLDTAAAVAVSGNYAYTLAASLNRLTIADVSDRSHPV